MRTTFAATLAISAIAVGVANAAQSTQAAELQARDYDNELLTRDLYNEDDLEARSPLAFGAIFKGARLAAKGIKAAVHHAHHHSKRDLLDEDEELEMRDVYNEDDLEARSPLAFGAIFKGARLAAKGIKAAVHHAHHHNKRDLLDEDEELEMRDVYNEDDLEARSPLAFGAIFKGARLAAKGIKAAVHHAHHHNKRDLLDDEEQELEMRDLYSEDELEARSPLAFGAIFKGARLAAKGIKAAVHHAHHHNKRDLLDDDEDMFDARDLDALLQGLDDYNMN